MSSTKLGDYLLPALLCPAWIRGEPLPSYKGRHGAPLLLNGPPGIGKTAQIVQASADLGMKCVLLPIESCDTEDLNGLIVRNTEGRLERLSDNQDLEELVELAEGVLLLDEVNANRGLGPSINRLLYDGIWCRKPLPSGIRILATKNPPHLSAGGRVLPPSQANRLCHLDVEAHGRDEWISFQTSTEARVLPSGGDPRNLLLENWAASRASTLVSLDRFFRESGITPQRTPAEGDPTLYGPWASERTWHLALNLAATCMALGSPEDVSSKLVEGCVGEELAIGWAMSRAKIVLPDIQAVLAGTWRAQECSTPSADLLYGVTQLLQLEMGNHPSEGTLHAGRAISASIQLLEDCIALNEKDVPFPLISKLRSSYGLGSLVYAGSWKEMNTRLLQVIRKYPANVYRGEIGAPLPGCTEGLRQEGSLLPGDPLLPQRGCGSQDPDPWGQPRDGPGLQPGLPRGEVPRGGGCAPLA